ncbi:hypothetical protein [Pararhizobium sp. DWP1-1-3]|uniref:hypothetical protein n=1 Tax=Pararhizobium sp. DWP1-1-3 TaxID=2804652 RepID=UPI003CF30076
MSEKKKRIYRALVDGATEGLSDKGLFEFVQKRVPKVSSKNIVRASLLALSDPDIKDGTILHTIYALAIKHRLDGGHADDDEDIATPIAEVAATDTPPKAKRSKAKNKQDTQPSA